MELVGGTVSCAGTPQLSWKVVDGWKKDFLKQKNIKELAEARKRENRNKTEAWQLCSSAGIKKT